MLQLQTKNIDILRISKLLSKYHIKARVTNSAITLDGDISLELFTQLCGNIDITSVQNFMSQEHLDVSRETLSITKHALHTPIVSEPEIFKVIENAEESEFAEELENVAKSENVDLSQPLHASLDNQQQYDLIYSQVNRGEVYWCDLGDSYYGSEQGGFRLVIVVQNDIGNFYSPTTIVIPCTTAEKKNLPTHYELKFSATTMVDYEPLKAPSALNTILAEQIQTVDKTRLRAYYGTLRPEIMTELQDKIDASLGLSREVKTIVEKEIVYVDRPIPEKLMVQPETPKHCQDVNIVQVQLLSLVDINELFKISQSDSTDEVKAHRILELFGFNFEQNGVQYLLKAIISSQKNTYFNLETLSKHVSKLENINPEEITRLIVARVKETFGFKKAPTIDFIRLVNNFLLKQEVINYENAKI